MAVTFIIFGVLAIIAGAKAKQFYVGDADAITSWDRPRSKTSGRVIFFTVGALFIIFGVTALLRSH